MVDFGASAPQRRLRKRRGKEKGGSCDPPVVFRSALSSLVEIRTEKVGGRGGEKEGSP